MTARPAVVERGADRRWHYRRSLASRVTLLTILAVGATVAALTLGAYLTVRVQLQSTLDESLLDRAYAASRTGVLADLTGPYRLPPWALGAADVRIAFIASDRSVRQTDDQAPLELGAPEIQVAEGEREHVVRTVTAEDGTRYRAATVPAVSRGQALVIAQSLESRDLVLQRLGIVMGLFGLAGVVAAGVAGWAVARNGLRPVRRLTTDVEEIARTEDLSPLRVEGDDEVARLAGAFNAMLAAVSASRARQRQLVADAGHELRTPLTSLRTNIDLLMQASGPDRSVDLDDAARAELLDDVRGQMEELTTLIGDLVELARDEVPSHTAEELDLAEVVQRAVVRVRRRAHRAEVVVDADPWLVTGEATSLERAVTNLVDNAVKWSPDGGTVTVALHDGRLTVDDEGTGIDPEDRPHVFDRFYRSTDARAMPGSGLGLSIVKQVAERHGGSVEASPSPGGGARLVLELPGVPPAQD